MKRTGVLTAGIAMAVLMSAPAADAQFKPSRQQQVELGQRVANDVRKKERVLSSNDIRVQTLRRVGNRLLSAADNRNEPWEFSFDVIENRQVNAFALPGGPIFFYTGMLEKLRTEDQLAGILAHEIMHIRNEHWASAYNDNQKRRLGLSALLMIFRANNTIANIASIADDVVFTLPYSRRHETEADERGMDMMVKAGYNPQGMADVFRMLGGGGVEFLSTHPDPQGRVANIERRIRGMNRDFAPQRPLPW